MSNKAYDFWKNMAMHALPALATAVITIFEIWGIPYGEQIGATITAVDVLLGVILKISSNKYYKKESEVNANN